MSDAVRWAGKGSGKSTIVEFIANKVFGEANSSIIQNAALDLFSRFSNAAIDRSIVICDEPEGLNALVQKLKYLVTSTKTRTERKGIDVTATPNHCNLIITTNDARVIRMEHRQRRYALFECDDLYVGNTAYFETLRAHMENPTVARSMYQYLMGIQNIETNFQATRPATAFFKEVMAESIPVIGAYLSARINGGLRDGDIINATDLKSYIGRLRADDSTIEDKGIKTLSTEIGKYKGLRAVVTNGCAFRVTSVEELRTGLQRTEEFNPTAAL